MTRQMFIETWPLHRRPGHHAALVWISGRIHAVFFGASVTAVIEAARAYVANIGNTGVEF